MHFLMPDHFPLYADFEPSNVIQEAKIEELHDKLKGMMLRHLKRDVIKSSPTKSEHILCVEMLVLQTHYYKNILTRVCLPSTGRSGDGELREKLTNNLPGPRDTES